VSVSWGAQPNDNDNDDDDEDDVDDDSDDDDDDDVDVDDDDFGDNIAFFHASSHLSSSIHPSIHLSIHSSIYHACKYSKYIHTFRPALHKEITHAFERIHRWDICIQEHT
jgi:hypothetical protein